MNTLHLTLERSLALAIGCAGALVPASQAWAVGPGCKVQAPSVASGSDVLVQARTDSTADGVVFLLDGRFAGHGFTPTGAPGRLFRFVETGTRENGWPSTGFANGPHRLSCMAWGAGGRGQVSAPATVTVDNAVSATLLNAIDQAEVGGSVTLTAQFTGPAAYLPSQATFTMDGTVLGQAPCQASGTSARCAYIWDTASTTAAIDWEVAMGLRAISVFATTPAGRVAASAKRALVNNHPGMALLLSAYEFSGMGRVGRDGGWSAALPSSQSGRTDRSFLTFGDGIFVPVTGPLKARPGAFAAVGRFGNTNAVAAHAARGFGPLEEVPSASGYPYAAPAISPITTLGRMHQPDGSACSSAYSWSTGVTRHPDTGELLISYWSLCGYGDGSWPHNQAFGIAQVSDRSGAAAMTDIFTAYGSDVPNRQQLMAPTFDERYFYWIRSEAGPWLARVPRAVQGEDKPWLDAARYEWYSEDPAVAGNWTSDQARATPMGPKGGGRHTTYMGRVPQLPGNPWLMITQDAWQQRISVFLAARPQGPWRAVPGWQKLTLCPSCSRGYYTVYAHPQTSDGSGLHLTFNDVQTGRMFQTRLAWPASVLALSD